MWFPFAAAIVLGSITSIFCSELHLNSMLILTLVMGVGGWLVYSPKIATPIILAYLLIFAWTDFVIQLRKRQALPRVGEQKNLTIAGRITDVPRYYRHGARFTLCEIQSGPPLSKRLGCVLLNWQNPPEGLIPGQRWQLQARLKRIHSMQNLGGFDGEKHAFYQGVVATGRVTGSENAILLGEDGAWFHRLRQYLSLQIDKADGSKESSAVLKALTLGIKNEIPHKLWRLFQATGTSHLMAISGLHIGFAATGGYVVMWLLCFCARTFRYSALPSQFFASGAALLVATFYTLLSGAATPALRALIMLACGLMGQFLRLPMSLMQRMCVAVVIIIVLDPLAPMTLGFWLSFGAVAAIGLGVAANQSNMKWLTTPVHVWIGLLPLGVMGFHYISFLSPLINLVAIPLVSFAVVLPALGVVIVTLICPYETAGPWQGLAWVLTKILAFLSWLEQWNISQFLPAPNYLSVCLALMGVVILLLPRALHLITPGMFCLIPLFFPEQKTMAPGDYQLTVLDVGQGLSVLIETQQHALLYDTGPPEAAHALEAVLRAKGIHKLHTVVVSHPDLDHAGNLALLASLGFVDKLLTSAPQTFPLLAFTCLAGQSFVVDGVDFSFLAPTYYEIQQQKNEASCVLKISGRFTSLIPGDIGHSVEQALVARDGPRLQSDVLVVPHHGSKHSSSTAFLHAVNPTYGAISAGYLNRYQHPHPELSGRYKNLNIKLNNTVKCGAIRYYFDIKQEHVIQECYRMEHQKVWHAF